MNQSQTSRPNLSVAAKWIAAAISLFVLFSVGSFLESSGVAQLAVLLGLIASLAVTAALRGRAFVLVSKPWPEALLALAWLAGAIGWGVIWQRVDGQLAILLLFIAPCRAAISWLWSTIRWVSAPRLQAVLASVAGAMSFVVFLGWVLRL